MRDAADTSRTQLRDQINLHTGCARTLGPRAEKCRPPWSIMASRLVTLREQLLAGDPSRHTTWPQSSPGRGTESTGSTRPLCRAGRTWRGEGGGVGGKGRQGAVVPGALGGWLRTCTAARYGVAGRWWPGVPLRGDRPAMDLHRFAVAGTGCGVTRGVWLSRDVDLVERGTDRGAIRPTAPGSEAVFGDCSGSGHRGVGWRGGAGALTQPLSR